MIEFWGFRKIHEVHVSKTHTIATQVASKRVLIYLREESHHIIIKMKATNLPALSWSYVGQPDVSKPSIAWIYTDIQLAYPYVKSDNKHRR